ncbi:helix-turn-helix transcriptional regulator [Streptomyces sp. NPDC048213]|uniref:helix-turn-helix domain-containing protein n=1 Tax=Streptomyces sp. NPDC048213 TaxID=3160984 RepID=UPI0033D0F3F9
MRIARGVQALLTRSGLTQTEVAKRAGVSPGTVNRYMSWQDTKGLRVPTVRAIADGCGATESERDALADLVTSQEDGWWMDHPAVPAILDPLLSFESFASYEQVWANVLVPGLLQSPGYALALHQDGNPDASAEDVADTVAARMQRQEVLDRSPALHLSVILDEAVLRRRVGDAQVMAEQIDHLVSMAERPNVNIQILPESSGAHAAGSGGHFVLLGREDRDPLASMAVVYLELHRKGIYLDAPDDVDDYRTMFDGLSANAADSATSMDLLASARQEYLQ